MSEQPKLEWIPVPKNGLLPEGRHALRYEGGSWVVSTVHPVQAPTVATHYCPIPEPVMPETVAQRCPWCRKLGVVVHKRERDVHVYCTCGLTGPARTSKVEAVEAWNRITLREVTP